MSAVNLLPPLASGAVHGAAPRPPAQVDELLRKELDSYRRAMPLQRLLGNGMDYADAVAIHAMAENGIHWVAAGEWLGQRNLELARRALNDRRVVTARSYFHHASACLRFAQIAIARDSDRKRALYRQMVDAFADAAALSTPPMQKVEVDWRGGKLCGWLMRPAIPEALGVVIQFGGFDGWREEYHSGSQYLVDRGLAVLLVDLPGQGETRLFHGLHMNAAVREAVSCYIDYLAGFMGLGQRVGVWGNSMGGCIAAMSALHDVRIAACCVNGGTVSPIEIVERYPRFSEKIEALTGIDDPVRAAAVLRGFDLSGQLSALTCPLLQLHSIPDQVFLLANARRIHDEAGSSDKSLVVWEDGDHCIYNHSHEKHCLVADWFVARLGTPTRFAGSTA